MAGAGVLTGSGGGLQRKAATILSLCALTAVATYLYLYSPSRAWYPSCVFHDVFGLHCSGCGTARALHALLHGDLAQAVAYNALTVGLLPFLLTWCVGQGWLMLTGRRLWRRAIPAWTIWSLLAIIVAFWILRNLPFAPFTLLAPNRIN